MNEYNVLEVLENIKQKSELDDTNESKIKLDNIEKIVLKTVINDLKNKKPYNEVNDYFLKSILSKVYNSQEYIDKFIKTLTYKNDSDYGIKALETLERIKEKSKLDDNDPSKIKLSEKEIKVLSKIISDLKENKPFNKDYKDTLQSIINEHGKEIFANEKYRDILLKIILTNAHLKSSEGPTQGTPEGPAQGTPEGPGETEREISWRDKLEQIQKKLNRGIPAENTTYNMIYAKLHKTSIKEKDMKEINRIISTWSMYLDSPSPRTPTQEGTQDEPTTETEEEVIGPIETEEEVIEPIETEEEVIEPIETVEELLTMIKEKLFDVEPGRGIPAINTTYNRIHSTFKKVNNHKKLDEKDKIIIEAIISVYKGLKKIDELPLTDSLDNLINRYNNKVETLDEEIDEEELEDIDEEDLSEASINIDSHAIESDEPVKVEKISIFKRINSKLKQKQTNKLAIIIQKLVDKAKLEVELDDDYFDEEELSETGGRTR